MPVSGGIFTRIWRFVDQFAQGENIERQHLDVALDDVAGGVDYILDNIGTLAGDAVDAAVTAAVGAQVTNAETAATDAAASAAASAISASEAEGYAAAMDALQINWRGPHATATAYGERDFVRCVTSPNSGNTYYCLVAHTSTTFNADLASGYWELFVPVGAPGAGSGDMLYSENLSGLTDVPAAQNNIGLGLTGKQTFMPVEQGGGVSMGSNKLRLGWHTSGFGLRAQVDATFLGYAVFNQSPSGNDATRLFASGLAPLFAARAFGAFSSTGSISTSGNIASVTKPVTGRYTVTFTQGMIGSTTYAVVATSSFAGGIITRITNKAAGSFQIETFNSAGVLTDAGVNFVVVD
jgi:hypothetical protein